MPAAGQGPLLDPDRLAALADLGLTHASEPAMERFAQRVRDQLGVPVSLVSLVQADQQVFPGMHGLPDPWATRRATPLSHSFCQHVVATGEPLVIDDAREDDLVCRNLATLEIGVVAYAGHPLTDDEGRVLGSLCAIDTEPRAWTPRELDLLQEAAQDCSNELRLRLSRLDAERERERRDSIDVQLQTAIVRAQRLLSIAEALNRCRTVDDVRHELTTFVDASTGLVATHLLLDGDPSLVLPDVPPSGPSGLLIVEDLAAGTGGLPATTLDRLDALGARAVGYLPVRGSAEGLAAIELVWDVPRRLDPDEHAMASALATYTGQALERALLLERRTSVAHQLQAAMLTELPHDSGLDLAALYLPARADERVGGDWYDVLTLPSPSGGPDAVVATVGDVTGHDTAAAAVMGQLRAMLRQAAWDAPDASPSALIAALERACDAFAIGATGTAALARLEPGGDGWRLTWVNAGHPPPLVVLADGTASILDEHDIMFGHTALQTGPRLDHHTDLPRGSTLVLHTDGVTDGTDLEPEVEQKALVELVRARHEDGADAVVDLLRTALTGRRDDVVVLVVRVP